MAEDVAERERLWRERVDSQADSGLAVAEFCEMVGVSPAAFYRWRKRLGGNTGRPRRRMAASSHPDRDGGVSLFVPVAVRGNSNDAIRLELAHEVIVHVPAVVSEARLVTIFRAAMLATETSPLIANSVAFPLHYTSLRS